MNPAILKKAADGTVLNTMRRHQAERELNALLPVAAQLVAPYFAQPGADDSFELRSSTYLDMYAMPCREVVVTCWKTTQPSMRSRADTKT